jgi:phage shock protein A
MMASKKQGLKETKLQDILEGVDAVGTIVEEDLNYLRKRLSEMQEEISKMHDEIKSVRLEQRAAENDQREMLETLKFMIEKLNRIEGKVIEGMDKTEISETYDIEDL